MGGDNSIELASTLPGQAEAGPLLSGSKAGEYEIIRRLGGGAMGDVYEGKHPVIGKRVAIKVIKQVLASSEEAAERFIREAKAVNQIDHPNVIDVFAFGRLSDGRLYLVMDLLKGDSLDQHLRKQGALSAEEFLPIMETICAAVSAAHRAGVVHRDLKPANVFLADTSDGKKKIFVLDFGVAKLMSSAQEKTGQTLTGQGVWIGTPAYMAPEQWTSEGASLHSDIYALGTMGFELLTGQSPFVADSIPGVMEMHFHAEIPSLKGTGKSIPRHLDDALRKAMAKEPTDRFDSAADLWAAISGQITVRTASKRPPTRAWVPAVLGAVLVVAAGGFFVAMKDHDASSRDSSDTAASATPAVDTTTAARVDTRPTGATVERDGQPIGTTPVSIPGEPGTDVSINVNKPGFLSQALTVRVGEQKSFDLIPVRGFEGVWQIPNGDLRRFERVNKDGRDQVAAYRLQNVEAKGEFYRMFAFVPGGSRIAFEASEEYVHETLPNEPSCRIELAAQYLFDPETQTMSTRKERAGVSALSGRCVVDARRWSDYEKVARVDVTNDVHIAESGAGGGPKLPTSNSTNNGGSLDDTAQFAKSRPPITPNGDKPSKKSQAKKKVLPSKKNRRKSGPPDKLGPTKSAAKKSLPTQKAPPVVQQQSKSPPVKNAAPPQNAKTPPVQKQRAAEPQQQARD